MFKVSLYLDNRSVKPGKEAPLKHKFTFKGQTVLIPLGLSVLPEYWDKKNQTIIIHPRRKAMNDFIVCKTTQVYDTIMALELSGKMKDIDLPALKDAIKTNNASLQNEPDNKGSFMKKYLSYTESREAEGTRSSYRQTLRKLQQYDSDLKSKSFEEIDKAYLVSFDSYLAKTCCRNTRNIHFRNIRAVFNDAIDDELTTSYPFRKFKMKTEPTRKRSLSVKELRTLRDYPVEEWQEQYRDIFILMFYLIGINAVDLLNAPRTALRNGRLEYIRAKTHKSYSIKVEPDAMEIIEKYYGEKYLLNIMDNRSNYKDWLHRMGKALKQIGKVTRSGLGGKKTVVPMFPDISQYWCRHTWATIAAELDIPKETIAAGLGHGNNTVTDIYIRYDYKKVDRANRKIIDFVNSDEEEY